MREFEKLVVDIFVSLIMAEFTAVEDSVNIEGAAIVTVFAAIGGSVNIRVALILVGLAAVVES